MLHQFTPEQTEKFWSHVDHSGGPDSCWPWLMSVNPKGYGQFWFRQDGVMRLFRTHRVASELMDGPIPEGMCVCHHCDNPPCCNPTHLFRASPAGNTADMVAKGRATVGERGSSAKLTADQVREIRKRYANGTRVHVLAKEYGVKQPTVSNIIARTTWKHL
jgi:hypothetical protein